MNEELINALKAARLHIEGEALPTKVQVLDIISHALDGAAQKNAVPVPRSGSATRYCLGCQQQRVVPDVSSDAMALLAKIVASDIGRATLSKLEGGQGTNTDEGRAWMAAAVLVSGGAPAASAKPPHEIFLKAMGITWEELDYDGDAWTAFVAGYDARPAPAASGAALTDADIDTIWRSMPGGPAGWLRSFGYQQFARQVEAAVLDCVEPAAAKAAAPSDCTAIAEEVRNAVHAIIGPGFHVRLAELDIASIIARAQSAADVRKAALEDAVDTLRAALGALIDTPHCYSSGQEYQAEQQRARDYAQAEAALASTEAAAIRSLNNKG